MKRVRGIFSREAGFTPVELLIAMVIMLVVLAAAYALWGGLQRTWSFTNDDMSAQAEARVAMGDLVEYIRTARQPAQAPSEALNLVIVQADANRLILWTDVDRDPDHAVELCRFRVDPSTRTLVRDQNTTGDMTFGTGTSVRMISNWVSNDATCPLFSYEDGNGAVLSTPVANPTLIREVLIDLRVDVNIASAPAVHDLRSVVQPRNLRDN